MRTATMLLAAAVFLGGCVAAGQTKEDKQRHVQNMRKEVLADLYEIYPDAAEEIKKAPGYAVFSNRSAYFLFLSAGQGYGVVVDNVSGANTYMQLGTFGAGLGLGVRDYRAVYVFEKRHIMEKFIEQGLNVGAQADATAKSGGDGEDVGGQKLFDGIKVYQLTEAGLALQATVEGMKFWRDPELN